MKKHFIYGLIWSVLLLGSSLLSGCSKPSAPELAREAETALEAGDTEKARALCDEAMASDGTSALTASQLARLSIIYMKIADKDTHDDGEAVGLAVTAYERAMSTSPDSALLYYSSVDNDDTRHVKMLQQVIRGLELPDSCLTEEPQID